MIEKAKADRLTHLEAQSLEALTLCADNYENAVFPNAMIVGDCVITHLLGKLGYLESGKVKVMVVDTYHLFDSTLPFKETLEAKYKFKAEVFGPADCETKDVYTKKYGEKLWVADVEVCAVVQEEADHFEPAVDRGRHEWRLTAGSACVDLGAVVEKHDRCGVVPVKSGDVQRRPTACRSIHTRAVPKHPHSRRAPELRASSRCGLCSPPNTKA